VDPATELILQLSETELRAMLLQLAGGSRNRDVQDGTVAEIQRRVGLDPGSFAFCAANSSMTRLIPDPSSTASLARCAAWCAGCTSAVATVRIGWPLPASIMSPRGRAAPPLANAVQLLT
jgi:hypothetical protein